MTTRAPAAVCATKVRYPTQGAVLRALAAIRRQRPYRCVACGGWHLTKMTKECARSVQKPDQAPKDQQDEGTYSDMLDELAVLLLAQP